MKELENSVEVDEGTRINVLRALCYIQGAVTELDLDPFYLEELTKLENTIAMGKDIRWECNKEDA